MQTKLLENNHIRLRAVEPDDAEIIYDWENNTDNWQVSNTLIPFSHHTIRKYAESASQDIFENRQLRLMIMDKQQDKAVGAIDLFDYDPFHQRAGVGILINNQEDRGRGYATKAIELVKDYVFNYLHLKQLYCNIGSDNEKSLRLFKKLGFDVCGIKKDWLRTFTGWIDEYTLQCINSEL